MQSPSSESGLSGTTEHLIPLAVGALGNEVGAVGKFDNLETRLIVPIEAVLDKVDVLLLKIGLLETINVFLDAIEMLSGKSTGAAISVKFSKEAA